MIIHEISCILSELIGNVRKARLMLEIVENVQHPGFFVKDSCFLRTKVSRQSFLKPQKWIKGHLTLSDNMTYS